MVETAVLALDVGGTTVEGGVVTSQGALVGPVLRIPSGEGRAARPIIEDLAGLLEELRDRAEEAGVELRGTMVAAPGPFDYHRGTPLMRHKFRSLYGLDLKGALQERLGLSVSFMKDAAAFALGAWRAEHSDESRLLGITLGTGVGSGFVVEGRVTEAGEGVPPGGEIWDLPLRGGILEDHVSARALRRAYRRATGREQEPARIAEAARRGDRAARRAFEAFGEALGEGLAMVEAFRPTRVVCGGRISRAFDLFAGPARAAFGGRTGSRLPLAAASAPHLPLRGAAWAILGPEHEGRPAAR